MYISLVLAICLGLLGCGRDAVGGGDRALHTGDGAPPGGDGAASTDLGVAADRAPPDRGYKAIDGGWRCNMPSYQGKQIWTCRPDTGHIYACVNNVPVAPRPG